MDMSKFTEAKDGRLLKHTEAIRKHQISVGVMLLNLNGYAVELHYMGRPLASEAQENLDELGHESIPIWSCSTKSGGIWTPWQRHALKYGELDTFTGRREGIPGEDCPQ
jgi:hypothetical protein